MVGNQQKTTFYKDKPIFGLDIGHSSVKLMQMDFADKSRKKSVLRGYGTANFDGSAINDGVIERPEVLAKTLKDFFSHDIIGDINTRRVALTIPTYRTFTRAISLPKLKPKELREAVEAEAERYIPLPLQDLYLDYEIINQQTDNLDILAVAIPRKIVDSYLLLCHIVGLEPVLIETTMHAAAKILGIDRIGSIPTMIIDFGSLSSDISLCANGRILVMGTVQGGGESFTRAIESGLGVSFEAAGLIKNKYGIGVSKKQKEIIAALKPTLEPIIKEIKRMLRYYEDRFSSEKPIEQIVILGGGANMSGLSDYLTSTLRLPTRTSDPWISFDTNRLQPPATEDKSMFSTVVGLSLTDETKVFD